MARLPRIVIPGQALHLIQRGNNRQATFYADKDYRFYLECLQDASAHHGCAIHAYVLMTNHVHLLLTPRAERAASLLMQSVGRRYVRYVNHAYQRSGTLWEGRFKSTLIDSERYLLTCSRYIELNPVRAGMVDDQGVSVIEIFSLRLRSCITGSRSASFHRGRSVSTNVYFGVNLNKICVFSGCFA